MAHDYDRRDRPATGEGTAEKSAAESDAAASDSAVSDSAELDAVGANDEEESAAENLPGLGRARLLDPRHALEIGQDGRVVASHYHEGRDAWEIVLETYESEPSG